MVACAVVVLLFDLLMNSGRQSGADVWAVRYAGAGNIKKHSAAGIPVRSVWFYG